MNRLLVILSFIIVTTTFSQVDSTYVYLVKVTTRLDKDFADVNVPFAIASLNDTLTFNDHNSFYPIGLPKDQKIDILFYLDSNVVTIRNITACMKFELWHYLDIRLTDFDQKCVLPTYWDVDWSQVIGEQYYDYTDVNGILPNGTSCHFSKIGSFYSEEYQYDPPKYKLMKK